MGVVIVGGHGKIARLLGRRLAAAGQPATGLIRNPAHAADLVADGMRHAFLDLESADRDAVAAALRDAGAPAVVFAAGAGPGSGAARKDTVDRGAAVLTAAAAQDAGVRRYLQISSVGTSEIDPSEPAAGDDDVFRAYLQAKRAAEDDLRARDGLDWTILRPGGLTDEHGTGRVTLLPAVAGGRAVTGGRIPRDDVAAVVIALLPAEASHGAVLELVGGTQPIDEAVPAALATWQDI
jgi:nucleoside-diphosphate-sugar epimerase